MIAILFTLAVLGALVFGYRISMYLYSNSAVDYRPRIMGRSEPAIIEAYPVQDVAVMERVHGMGYARAGILVVTVLVLMLAAVLVIALVAVL